MLEKLREYSKYLLLFLLAVFMFSFITNFETTMQFCSNVFGFFSFMLTRFFIGFVLAYMLNFFSSWLEKKFKFRPWLSITVTYLLFFGVLAWMIVYILPLMYDSVEQIFKALPQYYDTSRNFVNRIFFSFSESDRQIINDYLSQATQSILSALERYMDFSLVKSFVLSSTRILLNFFFGLMVSVYALIEKKSLLRVSKRLLYATIKKDRADAFVSFMSEANRIFSQFIVGKLLDSLVVGIISLILYAVFGLPLAAFFAVVAGVFNLIPYFGPWIGAAITLVVLVCFDPLYAVYALFITLAVQTLDSIYIVPKVLGGMVGISPLLTIIAITVGGDLAGFAGMFFGIPVLAVLKILIFDRVIKKRLQEREIEIK